MFFEMNGKIKNKNSHIIIFVAYNLNIFITFEANFKISLMRIEEINFKTKIADNENTN